MTAKQMIKKIEAAGISIQGIEITGKNEIEVKSERKAMKIYKMFPEAGGYKCGWGAWVIRWNYRSNPLVAMNMD